MRAGLPGRLAGYAGVLLYAIYDLRPKDRFADIPEEEPKISMTGH